MDKSSYYQAFDAKTFWRRSVFALVLTAVFATCYFIFSDMTQQHRDGIGREINVSGRQRMLSQRIALFAQEYMANSRLPGMERENRAHLKDVRDLFESSHLALTGAGQASSVVRDVHIDGRAGVIARDIYYQAPALLDQQVQRYVGLVDVILDAGQSEAAKKQALNDILSMSKSKLLNDLDQVVQKLEDYDYQSIQSFQNFQWGAYGVFLLFLLAEAAFIFWPTYRFTAIAMQQKQQLDKMDITKKMTQRARQAQSRFLASMSYELRSPLNTIMMMIQLIKGKNVSDEMRSSFDIISSSATSLLDVMRDLADLSKIETGDLNCDYKAFDIVAHVDEILCASQALAKSKKVTLNLEGPDDSCFILGDAGRLSRALGNLIHNAVFYSSSGEVAVSIAVHDMDGDTVWFSCSVRDHGVGIPEDQLQYVFDKWDHGDVQMARRTYGRGLGLALTKELVTLLGGEVTVQSDPDEGTCFTVSIPFEKADPASQQEEGEEDSRSFKGMVPLKAAKILVAEDHGMHQLLLERIFKEFQFDHYKIVDNGQDVLAAVQADKYDLILMDCHMPAMDGYETTKAIRNLSDPVQSSTPVIAMTANAMEEDEGKCLEAGMNDYIAKPLDLKALRRVLSRWIAFPDGAAGHMDDARPASSAA